MDPSVDMCWLEPPSRSPRDVNKEELPDCSPKVSSDSGRSSLSNHSTSDLEAVDLLAEAKTLQISGWSTKLSSRTSSRPEHVGLPTIIDTEQEDLESEMRDSEPTTTDRGFFESEDNAANLVRCGPRHPGVCARDESGRSLNRRLRRTGLAGMPARTDGFVSSPVQSPVVASLGSSQPVDMRLQFTDIVESEEEEEGDEEWACSQQPHPPKIIINFADYEDSVLSDVSDDELDSCASSRRSSISHLI